MTSDADWKKWGATDPYFGVITHEKFRGKNLNDENLNEFFKTGEMHIEHVYKIFRLYFDENFNPQRVLDFGCGAGRLLLPLSHRATEVVGVDVSEGMLDEARKNIERRGICNAELVLSNGTELVTKIKTQDFIHSYIVLQHVSVEAGEKILKVLLSKIKPGGYGALHFTISSSGSVLREFISAIRNRVPFLHYIFNAIQGKNFLEPRMQMTKYDLSKLLSFFEDYCIKQLLIEHTDHGGHLGVMFYFKRPLE